MKVGRSFEVAGSLPAAYEAAIAFCTSAGFRLMSANAPHGFAAQRGTAGGTALGLRTTDVSTTLAVRLADLGGRVAVSVEYDIVASVWLGLGDAPEQHKAALEAEIARLQHHLTTSLVSPRGPGAAGLTGVTPPPPVSSAFCPSCGRRVLGGRFCAACGAPLNQPT